MKFNLKNFPVLVADPTTNEQKIIEWKEGFEKQERQRVEDAERKAEESLQGVDEDKVLKSHDEQARLQTASYWNGYIQAKKEILGDSE